MSRLLSALVALSLLLGLLPAQAGQLNANAAWNSAYAPSNPSDQALYNYQALLDLQLRNGILNPNGVNNSTTNYNGSVSQTYTGPNSSSGSNVMNIDNLNSTIVTTNASGGSKVGVNTTTSQKANNSQQSGSATSNAATQGSGGIFDAANTIATGNH